MVHVQFTTVCVFFPVAVDNNQTQLNASGPLEITVDWDLPVELFPGASAMQPSVSDPW